MTNEVNVVELAAELVSIPSVNPMGRVISPQIAGEGRVTNWLERFFASQNIPSRRYFVRDDGDGLLRENIVARFDGSPTLDEGGALLMLEAHQDTVPVDGMTIEPFAAHQTDGKLFGRGACDIKGGLACLLTTATRILRSRAPRPTLLVACTVNEEFGFCGAKQLAALIDRGGDDLVPRRPDAIIVTEPTELNVVTCHKGMIRWVCETHGRAAHSSEPNTGANAIYSMAPVIVALEELAAELNDHVAHPLLGKPTLSVGTVTGGISVNTIPDSCRIEIDRRLLPAEEQHAARDQVIDAVRSKGGASLEHHPPFTTSPGLTAESNGRLSQLLLATATRHIPGRQIAGVPFGTDAAFLAQSGIPTVVFGPGSIDQAHTIDEWVDTVQLESCVEILVDFATSAVC
jgi:acetylornithine deacetylase